MSVWVFDLDGTLVSTNKFYWKPVSNFVDLMFEVFAQREPQFDEVIELVQGIDQENFKTMRASRGRFPQSMVDAYRELCRQAGEPVDIRVVMRCWEIGEAAFSQELYSGQPLIKGAQSVLEFLQKQGAYIFCVTAGDYMVQMWKYHGYPFLKPFFPDEENFIVVEWDKAQALSTIRKQFPIEYMFMVGDSIGSDLWPAHNAGIAPVYIPSPSVWDHGELVENLPPGTQKFNDMQHLLAALKTGKL